MPDRTLEASSLPPHQRSTAPKVVVHIRLLARDDRPADPSHLNLRETLANLASDLMSTSGGTLQEENENVTADFPDLQGAIRAARRMQWALVGLTEGEKLRGCSAFILIHSAEPDVKPSLDGVFAQCEPGQILLCLGIRSQIETVPGLQIRATRQEEWRELLWRSDEGPIALADDEQSILRIIREAGRKDPSPVVPELLIPAPEPSKDADSESQEPTIRVNSIDRRFEHTSFHGLQAKPWQIVTGAAAIVGLAAVFFIVAHHSKSLQSRTPPPAAMTEPAPAAPGSQPAAQPTVQDASKNKPSPVNQHASKKPAIDEPKPALIPNSASCDLTEGDIQRSLARADRNLHDGNLAEAEAEYRQVLGCPSARERAQDGLNRVAERKTAQDGGLARQ